MRPSKTFFKLCGPRANFSEKTVPRVTNGCRPLVYNNIVMLVIFITYKNVFETLFLMLYYLRTEQIYLLCLWLCLG